ncbi:lactonase family protein [Diplocloster modestus]|uniref:Lactonase family protein n=1 Tax=Diplocloster modestus TaxID=2850322 RepID=A0ABS6K845_9FIRM|nr:beta-propeller fold lactonase family protein [Diplocloster modestus]MBU9726695.1 lactonase family protein [Diplocloster modestus]
MGILTGYAGTYESAQSFGIYRFTIDGETGALTEPKLYYPAPNAKYVSLQKGKIAAPVERHKRAGICLVDLSAKDPAAEVFCEEQTACYVIQDGPRIYTANYHEGTVMVYEAQDKPGKEQDKSGKGLRLLKRIRIAPAAGCHQVILHGQYLLVPCLELDKIRIFDGSRNYEPAGEISFPAGSGPRHGIFNRDHTRFYLVTERSNELYTFRVDENAGFYQLDSRSVLPEKGTREDDTAALRISPDERFLYVSTRGSDLLSVFSLEDELPEAVQFVSCGGRHPRDFAIVPGGKFLLVANRFSNNLICFRLGGRTGRIKEICDAVTLDEAVSIVFDPESRKAEESYEGK